MKFSTRDFLYVTIQTALNDLDVDDVTKEDVFDAVKNAKNRNAVGLNGIPAEF